MPKKDSPRGCQVEFRTVEKTYERVRGRITEQLRALEPVSQTVMSGSFVSIIGPSGCGKSTLLEMAAGLRAPSKGSILVDGEPVSGPHPRSAMVFQEESLLPWRTAQQNVELALEAAKVPKGVRREKSAAVLDLVGLQGFESAHPRELSGGMKQRVAIARALVTRPDLLLMDEPFASLDQQTRINLGFELAAICEQSQATVIFVTHDFNEAVFLSDEVWVMASSPGRIVDVVPIDIERPRKGDLLESEVFHAYTSKLWSLLRHDKGEV